MGVGYRYSTVISEYTSLAMTKKQPIIERQIILKRDHRRKYGARLTFQVQRSSDIGELENVCLMLDDGTIATIRPGRISDSEGGKRYDIEVEGFATAVEAEQSGLKVAQSLLLLAVSLNFGLRLNYSTHEPPTVFDRTVGPGFSVWAELHSAWTPETVLSEFTKALSIPVNDRRLLLSMELFVAAQLESNNRTRFVMAVSALEPLAEQQTFGSEVSNSIDVLCSHFDADTSIPEGLRQSLRGRLNELKRESVRQSLRRLCSTWFPADSSAWSQIDRLYNLRSQMLHDGRPSDRDILLEEEMRSVTKYLRLIYQQAFDYKLYMASTD